MTATNAETLTRDSERAHTVEARERIAIAAGAALLVAGLVLVMVVLPSEYGVDPLGTGAKLGLLQMADAKADIDKAIAATTASNGGGDQPAVAPQKEGFRQETTEFRIPPGEFIEYKYRLDRGEALLYSWKATGAVNCEFHAEPDGAPRGYAETYEKQAAVRESSGTLTAPFPGIHGWYWQNTGDQEVTVTLTSAGFYNVAYTFPKDQPVQTKMFD
jgi:hypothetical protein